MSGTSTLRSELNSDICLSNGLVKQRKMSSIAFKARGSDKMQKLGRYFNAGKDLKHYMNYCFENAVL